MNRLIKWDIVEPKLGPPKPLGCVDGWGAHEWRLSIEEGQPSLSTDCNLCHDGVTGIYGIDCELYEMPAISVRIGIQSEPGNAYGMDPYWWLDITPVGNEVAA